MVKGRNGARLEQQALAGGARFVKQSNPFEESGENVDKQRYRDCRNRLSERITLLRHDGGTFGSAQGLWAIESGEELST